MIHISINGEPLRIGSVEEMDTALAGFEQQPQFELWASVPNGPSMAMLRIGVRAWLMYLRFNGDAGFVSQDPYSPAWCVSFERCYQAMMYFFANNGAKPDWIMWRES